MPKAQSPWDNAKARPKSGKFLKFKDVGDSASGTVAAVSFKTFNAGEEDEQTVPVVELDEGQSITCSARMLHEAMYEMRPQIGEFVEVTFVGIDEENYGRKLFRVDVTRIDGSAEYIDQAEEVAA